MTALPIAVIGLGDIAQKAYLPVLATQPGLDLRLMTRDRPSSTGSATPTGSGRASPTSTN